MIFTELEDQGFVKSTNTESHFRGPALSSAVNWNGQGIRMLPLDASSTRWVVNLSHLGDMLELESDQLWELELNISEYQLLGWTYETDIFVGQNTRYQQYPITWCSYSVNYQLCDMHRV